MSLTELKSKVPRKAQKRVGRGNGSNRGTYAGRGQKGQTSRSGGKRRPGFEGGQTPFAQKMPKLRGFRNPNQLDFLAINVGDLEERFGDKTELTLSDKRKPFKLLGDGEVTKAYTISIDKASTSAIQKITKAGGTVKVLMDAKTKTDKDKRAAKAEKAIKAVKKDSKTAETKVESKEEAPKEEK